MNYYYYLLEKALACGEFAAFLTGAGEYGEKPTPHSDNYPTDHYARMHFLCQEAAVRGPAFGQMIAGEILHLLEGDAAAFVHGLCCTREMYRMEQDEGLQLLSGSTALYRSAHEIIRRREAQLRSMQIADGAWENLWQLVQYTIDTLDQA